MHPRAAELIRDLDLQPHPEGGHFREVFRSAHRVRPLDARSSRSALTSIYFLLLDGQHSRWHRVASDEAWHFYEGDPLELFWIGPDDVLQRRILSRNAGGARPVWVVAAGCWQAARPLGAYCLAGCTVGPGFDYQDFEMITEGSPDWDRIRGVPGAPLELA